MTYEQLFTEIQKPENKVFKKIIHMMGGLENIKYSLRGEKKVMFYALGSDAGEFAPEWVIKAVFVDGQKQSSLSTEQIVAVFDALHDKYKKDEQNIILQTQQRTI